MCSYHICLNKTEWTRCTASYNSFFSSSPERIKFPKDKLASPPFNTRKLPHGVVLPQDMWAVTALPGPRARQWRGHRLLFPRPGFFFIRHSWFLDTMARDFFFYRFKAGAAERACDFLKITTCRSIWPFLLPL